MDFLLMIALLVGLATLGSTSLTWIIKLVAAQGVVLGALLIIAHTDELSLRLIALATASILMKGLVFPWFLSRSIREAGIQREIEPFIGFTLSLALGAVAIGVAFGLSHILTLPSSVASQLIVPVSLANVFFGFLLLVGRRKAITQVLGYLVMENGIFVFSLALAAALPILVEIGLLLDLFVAVFVMGIIIYQINREFDHIDASRLRHLQDLHAGRRHSPTSIRSHRNGSGNKQPVEARHSVPPPTAEENV